MAPRPQTRRVLDLRPRLHAVGAGDVFDDLIGRLELPHRLRPDPRRVVTLDAGNIAVGGSRSAVVLGFHDVVGFVVPGSRVVLDVAHSRHYQQDDGQNGDRD